MKMKVKMEIKREWREIDIYSWIERRPPSCIGRITPIFVMRIEDMPIHTVKIASSDDEGERSGHLLAL
jgi:hypothetical protein